MKSLKRVLVLLMALVSTFVVASCGDKDEVKYEQNELGHNVYYASPDGHDDALGTKEDPLNVEGAAVLARAGETTVFLGGTYYFSRPISLNNIGTEEKRINLVAEEGKEVIFDFSQMEFNTTSRGITVAGDYYHIYGVTVTGAGDNGMYISGSYNIVENCVFHDNRDTGLQIGRGGSSMNTIDEWPCNNLIKNCTSFNNFDDQTGGENADGFAAKLTVGYGNVFDGCIAYRNADDGWDLFAKQDSGNIGKVILYNCVSFENGFLYEKGQEVDENDNPITDPSYRTTLGDGIGFKLGGSIMKGDVLLYNCLAFNNRLHGVGDNSNPGVIEVVNTTTYNNAAVINMETGLVDKTLPLPEGDSSSTNFNLARTDASYNNYRGLLSYQSNVSLEPDQYQGSMAYSLTNAGKNTEGIQEYNLFESYVDASSYDSTKMGTLYENSLSDDSFKSVEAPSGCGNDHIHEDLRNEDGSVNMGDFLVLKDSTLATLQSGNPIGCTLNKTSYDEYNHYELFTNANLDADQEVVWGAYQSLSLTCDEEAVFQDFKLPTRVNGCDIVWYSSNPRVVEISNDVIVSNSESKEVDVKVYRQANDETVSLKALIIYRKRHLDTGTETDTWIYDDTLYAYKDFSINVKATDSKLGNVLINNNIEKVVLNQYDIYNIEKVTVSDGNSYSNKLLREDVDYKLEVKVDYQVNKSGEKITLSNVYTTNPGVYTVNYIARSTRNPNETSTASYVVYVIDPDQSVSFLGSPTVNVTKEGYTITGELDNVKATLYAYATESNKASVEEIIANGESYEIEEDVVDVVGTKDNDSAYYIHMVVVNSGEAKPSAIVTKEISIVEITNNEEFMALANGSSSSTTIYSLTTDLDFSAGYTASGSGNFEGLFNGNGHTIKNIDLEGQENLSIFAKMTNGTIMNVNFENLNFVNSSAERVGIIARMYGGYVHNVNVTNINISASRRIGAIVGHISDGNNHFSEISVINDENHILTGVNTTSGQDIGGIVGFVQNDSKVTSLKVEVTNCLVQANLGSGNNRYCGGMIGRLDDRISGVTTTIVGCIFEGVMKVDNYAGGMINFTTGAGKLTITNCAANITTIKQGNTLLVNEKNNSSIVGRYAITSGTGETIVNKCYGTLGEYYTFENGGNYEASQASIRSFTEENLINALINDIGLDTNIWGVSVSDSGAKIILK